MSENLNLKTIETIDPSPFKHLCVTIGELPSAFIESMSYYELLAWFVNYLENTVIPAVNANGEATAELQNLFIELKDFVDNYFENLDVQEEINNKLDQMAEDGTLQEIITTYIQSNVAWTFDTVADMKLATNLVAGSYARTLGFHSLNDGGGAIYKITDTGTANEMDIIAIGNLYAQLIYGNKINVKQFGAYGDGTHDDHDYIERAIAYIDSKQISEIQPPSSGRQFNNTPTLYFPTAKYKIDNKLIFNQDTRFYHLDGGNSFIISDGNESIFYFPSVSGTKCIIENFQFKGVATAIEYDATNNDVSQVIIKGCKFIGTTSDAIKYQNQSSMLKISDCVFSWCYHIINKIKGDNVEFENCWFSEFEAEEDNHASFILLAGENKFINCFFIPNGGYKQGVDQTSYSNLAWIQAGDDSTAQEVKILIDRCRFSAETNSKTIINWKAKNSNANQPSKSYIRILNTFGLACQLGGCIVKMWHLPLQYIVENSEITRESDTFMKFDSSLVFTSEINGAVNGYNRAYYMFDYAFKNIKTQTSTPWDNIPAEIAPFVRDTDFDVPMYVSSDHKKVSFYLGNVRLASTGFFKKMFVVKGFYAPLNQAVMSSFYGVLIFDAVNTSVESSASIRVKYVPLAEYLGGSSATVNVPITLTPTFQNNSDIITMSGNADVTLNLEISGNVYDYGQGYISIKQM